MDYKRIDVSKRGSQDANDQFNEIMEFVQAAAAEHTDYAEHYQRGYFTQLYDKLRTVVVTSGWIEGELPSNIAIISPMSDQQADRRGNELVGFGQQRDCRWRDIDSSYLNFLVEKAEQTIAFARSKLGQQILGEVDDDEEDQRADDD